MNEVIEQRTLRSKTFYRGDGTFSTRTYSRPVHFVDDADTMQDVVLVLEDKGTYWEMLQNNVQLRVMKDFGANWLILYRNRFKNFKTGTKANHTIKYEPKMLAWVNATNLSDMQVFRNQQPVTGVYDPLKNVIRWENAFGDGIHFEVTILRTGFKKEVVIDAKNKLELPPTANHKLVALFKYDGLKGDGATALTIKDDGTKTAWDGNAYKESLNGYDIGSDDVGHSLIHPAYIVDASSTSQSIKVFWRKYNGFLWQAKVLPKAFLNTATYPVRADTVTTVYPDADTETDTVDMTMYGGWYADWATARNYITSAGTYTGDTHTYNPGGYGIGTRYGNGNRYIYARYKMVVKYNIPAGSTITAAKVSLVLHYDAQYYDNDAQAYTTCVIHSRTTGSQTAYTSQDSNISYFGGSKICNDNLLSNTPTGGSRYDWTFNSTGLAAITANGSDQFIHIGMLEGHDYENTPVAADADSLCNRMAEYTGTASDPYLEITYTAGGGSTQELLTMMGIG